MDEEWLVNKSILQENPKDTEAQKMEKVVTALNINEKSLFIALAATHLTLIHITICSRYKRRDASTENILYHERFG